VKARYRISIPSVSLIFLTLAGFPAAGQSAAERPLARWLIEGAGKALRNESGTYIAETAAAYEAGVPDAYFMARIGEALAKKVPSTRVIGFLRSEMPSLLQVASLVSAFGWPDRDRRAQFLVDAMAAVRNGVDIASVRAVVASPGIASIDPLRAGAALGSLAAIWKVIPPGDSPAARGLGVELALSRIETSRYGSFVSLAARARTDGVSAAVFYGTVSGKLRGGSTFADIERAIRGGARP